LEGIGKKTADKLIRHFRSVKKIKEAPLEEIEKIVGKKKAEQIKEMQKEREA
jgi:excinuclease ABC subunit C